MNIRKNKINKCVVNTITEYVNNLKIKFLPELTVNLENNPPVSHKRYVYYIIFAPRKLFYLDEKVFQLFHTILSDQFTPDVFVRSYHYASECYRQNKNNNDKI